MKHTSALKHYPLSTLCLTAIVWLSLTTWFPEVPNIEEVPFYDKWAHFVMYGGWTSVIWWENRRHPLPRPLLWGVLVPVMTGGLLELAQAYLTTCRSGDWLDFLANSVGVLLGLGMSLLFRRPRVQA